ncbi:hypothetical protein PV350_31625 [Streptomyces sp. PA03-6a]|nr:hypothetical protein [Streptomyces sp. PA03-6a]
MRLMLRHFRPCTGPVQHRVVQPWHPPRHTALTDPAAYGFLVGDHAGLSTPAGLFSFAATALARAAGQRPRQKGLVKGHMARVEQLTPLLEPGDRRRGQLDVAFTAYPPYAHFRGPGRPRRRADAPSPPPAAAPRVALP